MSTTPVTKLPLVPDPSGRAKEASASGLVPVIHHVNLKTNKLDVLIDWYGRVAGLVPNFRWDGGAFMTNDGANHRLAILAGPDFVDDADRRHHAGMHHLAFEFESVSDLLDHFAALTEQGIAPAFTLNHGLTLSIYYRDPDDNHVELQADNFCSWEKSTDFIRTSPQFAADPIGPLVDPAALLEAKRAGVSDEELGRRSYAGEFAASEPADLLLP